MLRVDTERRFYAGLKIGVWRCRKYQKNPILIYAVHPLPLGILQFDHSVHPGHRKPLALDTVKLCLIHPHPAPLSSKGEGEKAVIEARFRNLTSFFLSNIV
jgi:hypothetical protein